MLSHQKMILGLYELALSTHQLCSRSNKLTTQVTLRYSSSTLTYTKLYYLQANH